jgi:hypothetical protein
MLRRLTLAAILIFASTSIVYPQSRCGRGLNLTIGCTGISFGDSERINGLRFNWSDGSLDVINGVNISFWRPERRVRGTINGLALGLIALGLAVMPVDHSAGLAVGILAGVSEGSMYGVNVGGLALVTEGRMEGINVGGLALVGQGSITGLNVGLSGRARSPD